MKRYLAAALAWMPAMVFAAPMTYVFDDHFGWTDETVSVESEEGGDFLDVTAHSTYGDPYLASQGYGLQIYTCTGTYSCGYDNHQIDGRGPDEYVHMDFGQDVLLTSLTFTFADKNDDFNLWADGVWVFDDESIDSGYMATYTFDSAVSGSSFYVGADYWDDEFKIWGVTADSISAVPVPAAIWLMASGLAGLGFVRRKKA